MIGDGPFPRPNLFTVGDAEAWEEQFLLLTYLLQMSAQQIAEIDHGFDPADADAWLAYPWQHEIERLHPRVDVEAMIARCR